MLGLGFPGGPKIEQVAATVSSTPIDLPRSWLVGTNDFSFSGLKTSLLYFMDDFQETESIKLKDVIASYQKAIIDTLVEKIKRALRITGYNRCVIAGGVAANKCLRHQLGIILPTKEIIFPELSYCTDNAAMISYLGELKIKLGNYESLDFSANPNLRLI